MAISASARVVLRSAVPARRMGVNSVLGAWCASLASTGVLCSSCISLDVSCFIPMVPTPGRRPIQFMNRMKMKKVSTIGRNSLALVFPLTDSVRSAMNSITISHRF